MADFVAERSRPKPSALGSAGDTKRLYAKLGGALAFRALPAVMHFGGYEIVCLLKLCICVPNAYTIMLLSLCLCVCVTGPSAPTKAVYCEHKRPQPACPHYCALHGELATLSFSLAAAAA